MRMHQKKKLGLASAAIRVSGFVRTIEFLLLPRLTQFPDLSLEDFVLFPHLL